MNTNHQKSIHEYKENLTMNLRRVIFHRNSLAGRLIFGPDSRLPDDPDTGGESRWLRKNADGKI